MGDLVADRLPGVDATAGVEQVGERDGPIERYPAHQLGVQEVLRAALDLPDALIGLLPARRCDVGQVGEERFGVGVATFHDLGEPGGGVEEFAVHVELTLVPGAVTDPHGPAVAPTG